MGLHVMIIIIIVIYTLCLFGTTKYLALNCDGQVVPMHL
jgi:hypothetical protein